MMCNEIFERTNMEFLPQFDKVIQIGTGGIGVTFIPSVSKEGVISWKNDGNLPNPEPVKIKGEDGYTPVKGTDYWTETDKAEMVAEVLSALPIYKGEVDS